ncbi:dTDP-4-dehydrorhamnose reductase (dTDP-4-keto-L-rhamnose reductase) (dTDP-6-deoxy-L-mannose dehydrogenase) (dTDP-L-rhamnose synthetase) [Candidatus Glomeribacter gigasporarum BEG34]|uniref:dTDP-4-dehydrorhamnose reductase n=1 Tax=Candidatus Glomeribacter gigasporarum BEG34 TaxID=1070319 RepID=G2J8J7_9BURK|nr:dTDP-4-dehydrorhamnose reductase [Candidatus Glomeribacter gigasporarum]CCD29094.1 dTDP-4-dehydrorhamnose reductase (dTDP-4-keto-L-rhamnose reductase) (dTDP-6-deoxy-L-mannose dehydrogenase) (dTDP-L-rhamnose synthetase) [Candidatus Glomeribacter gigasporarum BEG34]
MTSAQTILLTGPNGQVGFELMRTLQGLGRVIALDRNALDLSDVSQIRRVARELKPAVIVNPAAYTAVDQAEEEVAQAMQINAEAPAALAEEAKRLNAVLIHYSTDYVFDGAKEGAYMEDDAPNPRSVYGRSKWMGERAIAEACGAHLILRTSWVYGRRGKNFLLTMRRLAAERSELHIVDDQIGAPTWAVTIAALTAQIVAQGVAASRSDEGWWMRRSGIYHLSAAGATSWYGFARAIFECAPPARTPRLVPINTEQYPRPAKRPAHSRLCTDKLAHTFGLHPPGWRAALQLCLAAD